MALFYFYRALRWSGRRQARLAAAALLISLAGAAAPLASLPMAAASGPEAGRASDLASARGRGPAAACHRAALRALALNKVAQLRQQAGSDEALASFVAATIAPAWRSFLFSLSPAGATAERACGASGEPASAPEWPQFSELYLRTQAQWNEALARAPAINAERGRDRDAVCLVEKSIAARDAILAKYEDGCRARPSARGCRAPAAQPLRAGRLDLQSRLASNRLRYKQKWGTDALARLSCHE
jgi:hypothetical protein